MENLFTPTELMERQARIQRIAQRAEWHISRTRYPRLHTQAKRRRTNAHRQARLLQEVGYVLTVLTMFVAVVACLYA